MHFGCGVNISLHLTEANWVPPVVGIFIDAAKRQNPERRGLAIINTIIASCGLPRTHWVLFLGLLLILYTAMTGLQPSATRACIMGIVYWIAPLIESED